MSDIKTETPRVAKSAIERLEDLEKSIASNVAFQEGVLSSFKQAEDVINKLSKQVEQLYRSAYTTQVLTEELKNISSLTNFLSESVVAMIMALNEKQIVSETELRSKVDENKSDKRLKQEASLIEKGFLKEVEISERDSLLVIQQIGPSGETQVGRDHLNLQVVEDKFAEKFVGLKVGDSVSMDEGLSVKILRILKPAEVANIDIPEESPEQVESTEAATEQK